jgi:hypothetical protein
MSKQIFWKASATGLLLGLILQGCGGSGSSAAAGGSSQLANGVVTGFGSVFVDGSEIQDNTASVVTENADGTTSNSVLQMGQRVNVSHDGQGTASKITVDAAVIGAVSAVNTTALTLTVAGQSVSINTDSTAGPLTVWGGGYSSISDVTNGDLVEIHGTPVYNSTTSSYKVVATRVQKMTAISSIKVNGKISNINTTAKTFSLNGLTVAYGSATLRPTSATLSNDLLVSAYGPTSALSGTTLTASNVKVNRIQDSTATSTTAQVGGQVSLYNSSANTFEVQGIKVSVSSSTTITPTGAAVANNAYVKVSGTVGTDGSISATNIQVREQNTSSDLAVVKLIGVISDFVSNSSFVVRGIPVDASGINVTTSCPGVTLANGVSVQITATQQANTSVVLAKALTCRSASSTDIRPVDGVISSVDSTAKTFVLTPTNGTAQTVQWNDNTTFAGVTAATLSTTTQKVRVEGYLNGTTLVARVVSTASAGLDNQDFENRDGGTNNTTRPGWDNYRNNHH